MGFLIEVSHAYNALTSEGFFEGWIADSGTIEHMRDKLHWFDTYQPLPQHIIWPIGTLTGHKCHVTDTGNIKILVQFPTRIKVYLF